MTWKNELPEVKKGDKIKLIHSNNGATKYDGTICEVMLGRKTNDNIKVKVVSGEYAGHEFYVYYNGPTDEFCLADRKSLIAWHQGVVADLKEQIKSHQKEIDFYTKYEDEAEFVADKLEQLMKTKGVKGKAAILRELKESHYI